LVRQVTVWIGDGHDPASLIAPIAGEVRMTRPRTGTKNGDPDLPAGVHERNTLQFMRSECTCRPG
jgi:hypothetical protein